MKRNNLIYSMTIMALFIAIMAIFAFTPAGSIFQGAGFSITLLGVPLTIIACLYGPLMGAFAGAVWGSFALIQAFTGMDFIGTTILSSEMNAGLKFGGLVAICYSRIIVGFLAGLISDALRLVDKHGHWSSVVTGLSVGILNTAIFMTLFCAFYYKTETIQNLCAQFNLNPNNAWLFSIAFVGPINIPVEWSVNAGVGGLAAYGVIVGTKKAHIENPFPRFFKKESSQENVLIPSDKEVNEENIDLINGDNK